MHVAQSDDKNTLRAVAALQSTFSTFGAHVLTKTLRTLRDAFDGDASGFGGLLITGLSMVYERYGKVAHEADMIRMLSTLPRGTMRIDREVALVVETMGATKRSATAAALIRLYNKGKKGGARIPSWWKSEAA